jgi:hypothetical protein
MMQNSVNPIRTFFRPEGPEQLSAPGIAWGHEVLPCIRPERAAQSVLGATRRPTTALPFQGENETSPFTLGVAQG